DPMPCEPSRPDSETTVGPTRWATPMTAREYASSNSASAAALGAISDGFWAGAPDDAESSASRRKNAAANRFSDMISRLPWSEGAASIAIEVHPPELYRPGEVTLQRPQPGIIQPKG